MEDRRRVEKKRFLCSYMKFPLKEDIAQEISRFNPFSAQARGVNKGLC
jgi:hypothetical protein